jgi:hypothetical protein
VLKIKDSSQYNNIADLLTSINVHNDIFPETRQTILGFARNKEGELSVALKQPKIEGIKATKDEIIKDMKNRGFEYITGNTYESGDVVISDLFPSDVIKDKDGNLHYIDSIIKDSKNKDK